MKLQLSRAALAILLSLVAALLPFSGGAERARAGGGWSVWLYNGATGALARVFPDGLAPETYSFPLPLGVADPPYALAFSPNGDRMAACLTDLSGVTSVRVYDIYYALYRAMYEALGPVEGCWLEPGSFSEDGSQLAVGLFNHYPDPADPRPEWELLVIHAETGAAIYRLTARDPQIAALGLDISGTIPAVVRFEPQTATTPGEIAFKPIWYGTEGAPEYHSLVWRLADGSVRVEGLHGKGGYDQLAASGEVAYLDEFDWLPKGVLEGPGYLYNVVMYAAPGSEPFVVFQAGAAVLGSPTFIDGGRRLAAYRYIPPGPPDWTVIERDGTYRALPIADEVYQLWGTPDGYVSFSDGEFGVSPPMVRYGRFLPDGTVETHDAWSGALGEVWRVVWVSPLTGGDGLPPFGPFALLGAPPVMTPTASAPFGLAIGGMALINTTEGDFLRVRSGPGTAYAVLFQLSNGSLVTVREGPLSGGEYTWWRIETGDGRSGWVVDGVPEAGGWLQTLVPVGG